MKFVNIEGERKEFTHQRTYVSYDTLRMGEKRLSILYPLCPVGPCFQKNGKTRVFWRLVEGIKSNHYTERVRRMPG